MACGILAYSIRDDIAGSDPGWCIPEFLQEVLTMEEQPKRDGTVLQARWSLRDDLAG